MVVCFSTGKTSESVTKKLKSVLDNVEFYSYNSIQELIKDSTLRHLSFKRIVISNVIIKDAEKDLKELNDFIKDYSSNTEVVLILNTNIVNVSKVEKVFNEIFNSPMYTPVKLGKITPKTLKEVIISDITEVQVKYYPQDSLKSEPSKNSSDFSKENFEDLNSSEYTVNSMESSGNLEQSNSSFESNISANENSTNGYNLNYDLNKEAELSAEISEVPPSVGAISNVGEDFDDDLEELSLGEFGSSHSDTGFLDEDEENSDEELQRFIQNKDVQEEVHIKEKIEPIKQPLVEVQRNNNIPTRVNLSSNIDILLSLRELSSTQEIIDEAIRIVNTDHASVLIIDLDYRENRVLSFIDVEKFYQKGNSNGINKQRVYMEDGVGIISNGYGIKITPESVRDLLLSTIVKSYEVVFIDCPLDCVNVLPEDVLNSYSIILKPGVNLPQFISTSRQLCSREIVSLQQERLIMSKCLLDMDNYNKDDINLLKSLCLFSNGSWVDRIGL